MHWKKSLLEIHKILRLFGNTLIVDKKHYLLNGDNLTRPIQMQLYEEEKIFPEFFLGFLKSIWNFKHLPKNDALIADVFGEIRVSKNMVI